MFGFPGNSYPPANCGCVSRCPLDEDIKISDVVKEMTKYVTALTAITGINNYRELEDVDKKYLFDKACGLIESLNDLKDIFQVTEIINGKGDNNDGC